MPVPSLRCIAVYAVLSVALLMAGCNKPEQNTAPVEAAAQRVGIVTLQSEPWEQVSELPGRTTAFRVAEVRPQVSGIILKRMFEEGSEVEAGQQLYQIDPAIYQANLQNAQAQVLSSRSLAERYEQLIKRQAISRQQYDEARAASLQADAALQKAQIELRYTRVLAPIEGRIGRSLASEGALVTSGQAGELASIQQIDPIYVDVVRSSRELLQLRSDMAEGRLQMVDAEAAEVSLILEDGSRYAHTGRLEFSEVSVDPGTGSVTLRALFPNPERLLLPGMFVRAQLVAGRQEQAILAPQQGITRNPRGQPVALVVNSDGVVEQRLLRAERTDGNRWLVSEGLHAGDQLITEGVQHVRPGDPVETQPAQNLDNTH